MLPTANYLKNGGFNKKNRGGMDTNHSWGAKRQQNTGKTLLHFCRIAFYLLVYCMADQSSGVLLTSPEEYEARLGHSQPRSWGGLLCSHALCAFLCVRVLYIFNPAADA